MKNELILSEIFGRKNAPSFTEAFSHDCVMKIILARITSLISRQLLQKKRVKLLLKICLDLQRKVKVLLVFR